MPAPASERVILFLHDAVSVARVKLEVMSRCWKDCELLHEGGKD